MVQGCCKEMLPNNWWTTCESRSIVGICCTCGQKFVCLVEMVNHQGPWKQWATRHTIELKGQSRKMAHSAIGHHKNQAHVAIDGWRKHNREKWLTKCYITVQKLANFILWALKAGVRARLFFLHSSPLVANMTSYILPSRWVTRIPCWFWKRELHNSRITHTHTEVRTIANCLPHTGVRGSTCD